MDVRIKLHTDNEACKPCKAKGGDWYDLAARRDVILSKGHCHLVPLGVSIELPKGYEALVIPRSSTFKRSGALKANSVGLIDEAYCGDNDEWCFPVYATRDAVIREGERVCQFRVIEHQPELAFEYVDELGNADRDGFGSTGV